MLQISYSQEEVKKQEKPRSNENDLVQFIEDNIPIYKDHSLDEIFSVDTSSKPKKEIKLQITKNQEEVEKQEASSHSDDNDLVHFIEDNVPIYRDHSLDHMFPSDQITEQKKVNQRERAEFLQRQEKSSVSKTTNSLPSPKDDESMDGKSFISKRSKQIHKEMRNIARPKPKEPAPMQEEKFTFKPQYQSTPKLRENAKELVKKRKEEKEEKEKALMQQHLRSQKKQKPKGAPKINRKLLSVLIKFDSDSD